MRGKNLNILYKPVPRKNAVKEESMIKDVCDVLSLISEASQKATPGRKPITYNQVIKLVEKSTLKVRSKNNQVLTGKVLDEIQSALETYYNFSFESVQDIAIGAFELAVEKHREYLLKNINSL